MTQHNEDYTLQDLLALKVTIPAPKRVVLCGSTRFFSTFQEVAFAETLVGNIVLSIGCDTKSGRGLALTREDKIALDLLHLGKVDLAHEMCVIDVGGYIGASTLREIQYAYMQAKPVRYLEPCWITDYCSNCGYLFHYTGDHLERVSELYSLAPCGCSWDCLKHVEYGTE